MWLHVGRRPDKATFPFYSPVFILAIDSSLLTNCYAALMVETLSPIHTFIASKPHVEYYQRPDS